MRDPNTNMGKCRDSHIWNGTIEWVSKSPGFADYQKKLPTSIKADDQNSYELINFPNIMEVKFEKVPHDIYKFEGCHLELCEDCNTQDKDYLDFLVELAPGNSGSFQMKMDDCVILQQKHNDVFYKIHTILIYRKAENFKTYIFIATDRFYFEDKELCSSYFQRHRCLMERYFTTENKYDEHFRRAEAMYLRMSKYFPQKIISIDYIENVHLKESYESQKAEFTRMGIDNKELLLFHGTDDSNIVQICLDNFKLDAIPKDGRCKAAAYGKGIYFSEFPVTSLKYGNALMLCRVLPGNAYGPNNASTYHSKMIQKTVPGYDPEYCYIHVVNSPKQILPYCVIKLEPLSLSEEMKNMQDYQAFHLSNLSAMPIQPSNATVQRQSIGNPNPFGNVSGNHLIKPIHSNLNTSMNSSISARVNLTTSGGISSSTNTSMKRTSVFSSMSSLTKKRKVSKSGSVYSIVSLMSNPSPKEVLENHSKKHGIPPDNKDTCPICLCLYQDKSMYGQSLCVQMKICKHIFHFDCLEAMFKVNNNKSYITCSVCKTIHGIKCGNQPSGVMNWKTTDKTLPGFNDGSKTIIITYKFDSGIQKDEHPNPGVLYTAKNFPRTAYLPDNDKGQHVLYLLTIAFERRLTFTVGRSLTSGQDNCITWNGIPHKTDNVSNYNGHGYPDDNYLDNVIAELKNVGVE